MTDVVEEGSGGVQSTTVVGGQEEVRKKDGSEGKRKKKPANKKKSREFVTAGPFDHKADPAQKNFTTEDRDPKLRKYKAGQVGATSPNTMKTVQSGGDNTKTMEKGEGSRVQQRKLQFEQSVGHATVHNASPVGDGTWNARPPDLQHVEPIRSKFFEHGTADGEDADIHEVESDEDVEEEGDMNTGDTIVLL